MPPRCGVRDEGCRLGRGSKRAPDEGCRNEGGQHGERSPGRKHGSLVVPRGGKDGPKGAARTRDSQVDGVLLQREQRRAQGGVESGRDDCEDRRDGSRIAQSRQGARGDGRGDARPARTQGCDAQTEAGEPACQQRPPVEAVAQPACQRVGDEPAEADDGEVDPLVQPGADRAQVRRREAEEQPVAEGGEDGCSEYEGDEARVAGEAAAQGGQQVGCGVGAVRRSPFPRLRPSCGRCPAGRARTRAPRATRMRARRNRVGIRRRRRGRTPLRGPPSAMPRSRSDRGPGTAPTCRRETSRPPRRWRRDRTPQSPRPGCSARTGRARTSRRGRTARFPARTTPGRAP